MGRDKEFMKRMRKKRRVLTLEERFWPKVEKKGPDECWLWIGCLNSMGYGQIYTGAGQRPTMMPAHAASLKIHGTEVPSRWTTGLVVDHICKVPRCVNPAHLRVVKQVDNCTVLARPTPFYVNMQKTHCKRGHPLSGDNLGIEYRYGKPYRQCKACVKLRPSYVKKLAIYKNSSEAK